MIDSKERMANLFPEQNLHRRILAKLFKQASYHTFSYTGNTNKYNLKRFIESDKKLDRKIYWKRKTGSVITKLSFKENPFLFNFMDDWNFQSENISDTPWNLLVYKTSNPVNMDK